MTDLVRRHPDVRDADRAYRTAHNAHMDAERAFSDATARFRRKPNADAFVALADAARVLMDKRTAHDAALSKLQATVEAVTAVENTHA